MKSTKAGVIYIGIYVDDLMVLASNTTSMVWISSRLQKRWETTHHVGDDLNYVGLHIVRDRRNRSIHVDMSGNIKKVIEQFGTDIKECQTPAVDSILVQSGPTLPEKERSVYLSLVMSVLYPARLCHIAILFPTVILATRLTNATQSDLDAAYRIVGYLKTQVNSGFTIKGTPDSVILRLYVDASHGLHPDGRGHACIVVYLGDSAIAWRCYKLLHVCISSTESEISAVSEAITLVIWIRALLAFLGFEQRDPTPVGQDNMSAVTIMENGPQFKRGKHMVVRYQFLLESMQEGIISFFRCPTDSHVADIGTKVHSSSKLVHLLSLLNWTK
jgi:hypothetical protein